MNTKTLIALAALALTSACHSVETIPMVNTDTKQVAACEPSTLSFLLGGKAGAEASLDECFETMQQAGYVQARPIGYWGW